jgi:hypothetical protein
VEAEVETLSASIRKDLAGRQTLRSATSRVINGGRPCHTAIRNKTVSP